MTKEKVCSTCGNEYSGAECPECLELERLNLLPSLPFVGFVFFLLLVIGFSSTRIAVSSFQAKQRTIANRWQSRGVVDLNRGLPDAAVEAFENALVYDRENASYRLQLAKALVQAGRDEEAQSHLRNLWEERPGDSTVNLQLGRLAARSGDMDQAERYYEGAIYGAWPDQQDPYLQREQTRLELAQALIAAKRNEHARAQLETLSAELPTSSLRRKDVGDLLMKAGAPRLAFQQYLEARNRSKNSSNSYALEIAKAAFAQNDFALATKWANIAVHEDSKSEEAENLAKKASQVLASDPYQPGIGEQKRAERVIRAFHTVDARMANCFPLYSFKPPSDSKGVVASLPGMTPALMKQVGNFSTWGDQLRPQMITRRLQHRDDVEENAMRLVFQAEQFASKNCSLPPTEDDDSLTLLAKERWSNE
jgi:thioredoxin-like negative regulator of GroEL